MRLPSTSPAAVFAAALLTALSLPAQEISPEGLEFFETKIRPVLAKNCYACHSAEAKTRMGGLTADTRAGLLAGGQRGHAVVPGSLDESVLMEALRSEGKLKMPPMGKLPDDVIADFEQWIQMGAPDPREGKTQVSSNIDLEKGREFWAFQRPARPAAPEVQRIDWPRGAVDQFILARLEAKGLEPVADADRAALLRRASFDLVGLPPTPEELESFLQDSDPTPQAFRKVVDRLLDSPQFGERWARHWFDVARYAETIGRTRNAPMPLAWRYRDYVIDSFNADKPYDEFVREQLAGDLLPAANETDRRENKVATGFLALGAHDLNEPDKKLFPADVADEMINVTTRSFLALTVGCARCHDHKFDPIPQKDYYAMAGIFHSTELRQGLRQRPRFNSVFFDRTKALHLDGLVDSSASEYERLWAELMEAEEARDRDRTREIAKQLNALPLPENLAIGVTEAVKPSHTKLNIGGDPHELGDVVPRGFVQVLYEPEAELPTIPKKQSGRLQLAKWLTHEDNPLTARVMVNRVWHHLFGRGLVKTVDNFGKMGEKPSHPELLDYLAVQFVEQGWSVKALIREIVLSRAYQLSTDFDEDNFQKEPDNVLVWRMNRRRLEVEALRDSVLRASGELKLERPQGSPVAEWDRNQLVRPGNKQIKPWETTAPYRSIYVPIVRNVVNRFYETFDFPEPSETHGARDVTTVAPQALFLMNSDFTMRHAAIAAERTLAAADSDEERIRIAFRRTLSREATADEIASAAKFIQTVQSSDEAEVKPAANRKRRGRRGQRESSGVGNAEQAAWARFYHALMNSAEFRYRG